MEKIKEIKEIKHFIIYLKVLAYIPRNFSFSIIYSLLIIGILIIGLSSRKSILNWLKIKSNLFRIIYKSNLFMWNSTYDSLSLQILHNKNS